MNGSTLTGAILTNAALSVKIVFFSKYNHVEFAINLSAFKALNEKHKQIYFYS